MFTYLRAKWSELCYRIVTSSFVNYECSRCHARGAQPCARWCENFDLEGL